MRMSKAARNVLKGNADHGGKTVQVCVTMPARDLEIIDALAAKTGQNRSRFILNTVRAHIGSKLRNQAAAIRAYSDLDEL